MPFHPEHTPRPELNPKLVEAYAHVFIQRWDCYPVQLPNGSYYSKKEPLTLEVVREHLLGNTTIGVYMLSPDDLAQTLCFDADEEEQWQAIKQLSKDLGKEGVFTYLERSRRGGHCWLFTPPLEGKVIRDFARQLLVTFNAPKMEIYPKQDRLRTGAGSLVRLPLGIHQKTGKRYPFIASTGEPLAPTMRQQLAVLANPARVAQDFIDHILAQIEDPAPQRKEKFAAIPKASGDTLSERIKRSISVLDFVSRYVDLDANGKGFCPFHEDEHQSFGVNQERNFWHCYAGCGGGSVIDFWIKWRQKYGQDASFTATITELAQLLF